MQLDRLYQCLEEWQNYYKHSNVEKEFNLGYPSQSLVVQSGGGSALDAFDHMCDDMDSEVVRSMDAMIDSLKDPQKDAIRHQWLGEPKKWPTHELDYDEALFNLMNMADKRGME